MLTTSELEGMRATSRTALPALGRVTRSGVPTFDAGDGSYTVTDTDVYDGPVRVRPAGGAEVETTTGDLHETVGRYVATFPYDAELLADDVLTVYESSDGYMQDRPLRVVHVGLSDWQVDRRVVVEDLEQPRPDEAGS